MSCDSTDDEYHLTPHGWVEGTHSFDNSPEKIIERPIDTVETWVRSMRQSYSMAPEKIEWHRTFVSPNYSESYKAELNKKYPKPKW